MENSNKKQTENLDSSLNETSSSQEAHSKSGSICAICTKNSLNNKNGIFLVISHTPPQAICDKCVSNMSDIISDEKSKSEPKVEEITAYPKEIYLKLAEVVISQDDAKKKIAIAIAQHQRRLKDPSIKKSNILLAGPTGTGKTELARAVSQIMKVPFVITDATNLTARGYIGGDVESIIEQLLVSCNFDIKKAEKGIVFIDEIDKIARIHNPDSGANTTSVQQELLKILEGSSITIKRKSSYGHEEFKINTSNILFICSGAFDGIKPKENTMTIGLSSMAKDESENFIMDNQSLIKYGFIPEFIGRFSVIAETKELTRADLLKILVEPKNSIISQYKKLFIMDDIQLEFSNKYLESIVDEALKEKTGARGLKTILEKKLESLYYDIDQHKNKKITLCSDEENKYNNEDINNVKKIAS